MASATLIGNFEYVSTQPKAPDETDDEADHAGQPCRVGEDLRDLPERGLAIEDRRHQQGIDHRHGCGLGRREPAEQNATHDDHRNHQRRQRVAQDRHELRQGRRRLFRIVALPGDHEHRHGHAAADQQARNDAGREHRRHGFLGHPGIDDGDDRRRDDGGHHGGGDGQRCGEVEVVALAHHLRNEKRAERGHIGHRRARDAAEEHAVDHVHVGEPAAEAADQRRGKVDDDPGDAAARGDIAGQDEQRRRQQQIGIRQQAYEAGRDDDRVEGREQHGRA